MIDIWIPGIPQPKGSTSLFRGRITSANPKLKGWEEDIRNTLFAHRCEYIPGPVTVELGFAMPRPAIHQPRPNSRDPLKRHPVPSVKPDLDKLTRAILDSLTKVVISDDAVVLGINAYKFYSEDPGVRIKVEAYPTVET
jgi:Holliday junction resolvase RusA-like endonuclease